MDEEDKEKYEDFVNESRAIIHDALVEEVFKDKGGEYFSTINARDIELAFHLYDNFIFGGQIMRKIREDDSIIKFDIKGKISDTGYIIVKNEIQYFLNISPSVLREVHSNKPVYNTEGEEIICGDRVYCLQFIMEHELIHLLMVLYGQLNKIKKDPLGIYTKEGRLYQCMVRYFFGPDASIDHDMGIALKSDKSFPQSSILKKPSKKPSKKPKGKTQSISKDPVGKLRWFSNSCYLDSLLMILLVSDGSNFFREEISSSNVQEYVYPSVICHKGSKIKTQANIRNLAEQVRVQLGKDYERLKKGDIFSCTLLRRLLGQCYPIVGTRRFYSTTDIYDLIATLFPKLEMYFTPRIEISGDSIKRIFDLKGRAMFLTQDLISQQFNINDVNHPVLVFQTSGDSIEIYEEGNYQEYMFEGRYRLFGAIHLSGDILEEEGVHYTSYIRIQDDWYEYNDSPPTLYNRGKEMPAEALVYTEDDIPELLFYQLVRRKENVAPVEKYISWGHDHPKIWELRVENPGDNRVVTMFFYDKTGIMKDTILKLGGTPTKENNVYYWRILRENFNTTLSSIIKPVQKITDTLK